MLTGIFYSLGLCLIGGILYIFFVFALGRDNTVTQETPSYSVTSLPAAKEVTARDIDKLAFTTRFRGYSTQEVDWVLEKLQRTITELRGQASEDTNVQDNEDDSTTVSVESSTAVSPEIASISEEPETAVDEPTIEDSSTEDDYGYIAEKSSAEITEQTDTQHIIADDTEEEQQPLDEKSSLQEETISAAHDLEDCEQTAQTLLTDGEDDPLTESPEHLISEKNPMVENREKNTATGQGTDLNTITENEEEELSVETHDLRDDSDDEPVTIDFYREEKADPALVDDPHWIIIDEEIDGPLEQDDSVHIIIDPWS